MADKYTEAELKALYPSTPRLWPSLVPAQELSTDRARRAAQIQFPNSPSRWPEPVDLDKELARLEALAAENAKAYPNSPEMISYEVNASRNRVIESMVADQREIDAAKADLAASQGE